MKEFEEVKNLPFYEKYQYLLTQLDERLEKELDADKKDVVDIIEKYNEEKRSIIENWKKEIKHLRAKEGFDEFKIFKMVFRKDDSRIEILLKSVLPEEDTRHVIGLFIDQNEFHIKTFNNWCKKNKILVEAIPINEVTVIGVL